MLKAGGVLMSGLDIGINYAFNEDETTLVNVLPFNPIKHPSHLKQMQKSNGGIQFSHTLEEQINGQLEAGFILTHLYDDTNGSGNLCDHNITSYIATRSVKRA